MTAKDYLRFIVQEIHTIVVATVDDSGFPVTCAIDIMDFDEDGLYFLTAKGKGFYNRLKSKGYIALTGIKGNSTMTRVAVSVSGYVMELGSEKTTEMFDKNPYMYEIYPDTDSQKAISVFKLYKGSGEWFDLSKKPIERASFSFGGESAKSEGYFVTESCIGCGACYSDCPQKCIDISSIPVRIKQENCLHCGNCFEVCPQSAIEKRV